MLLQWLENMRWWIGARDFDPNAVMASRLVFLTLKKVSHVTRISDMRDLPLSCGVCS